ncbi:MAG TPA: metal ABC transporter ATP-binding protein [Anaerolineales bacterium]|nr:metal ABC transporter ATP-binding protein [Anaerolineales bacterium]
MDQILFRPPQHDDTLPPIQVENLSVRYNGDLALSDVTFRLERGQRVAVVGPNGAGKTSLLKVISGVMRPSAGSVRIYGHGPGGHVCIAYLPQRSQVDWAFPVTVSEVVMMGRTRKLGYLRWPRRSDRDLIRWSLQRVGMAELGPRRFAELSGGQQQRVFLAQALAQEAELILLDEPLSGLDLPSQEAILDLLDALSASGVTLMITTHDLNVAVERFDQVVLLNRRLIAYGPARQVLSRSALIKAYGAHVHRLPDGEEGLLVVTDTCCEGEEVEG